VGGTESPIELMWGIGVVNWQKDGRLLDRPLLESRVDIELDDKRGGLIRVRPTGADALFDLKPYEELGCANLLSLADLLRREIQRTGENEGISPFARESFEPILSQAGVRLDPEGCYAPDRATAAVESDTSHPSRLTVTDKWVLFARPEALQQRSTGNHSETVEGGWPRRAGSARNGKDPHDRKLDLPRDGDGTARPCCFARRGGAGGSKRAASRGSPATRHRRTFQ
jgi:hypothetical protein